MSLAKTLDRHLTQSGVGFDVVSHPRTLSSTRTAEVAHVSGERLAKAVVLHDEQGYLLAVVPSTHRLELDAVQRLVDRSMSLATEGEIADLFGDCELGAVPPVGPAYGLNVLMDESLADQSEVYFEGGDHRSLVRVNGADFDALMVEAQRGRFSHHV